MNENDHITFWCPQCGGRMNVRRKYAGKRGRCEFCNAGVTVPLPFPIENEGYIDKCLYNIQEARDKISLGVTSIIIWLAVLIFVIFTIGYLSPDKYKGSNRSNKRDPIVEQFNSDGSHRTFVIDVKKELLDPDSFQHDETRLRIVDEGVFLFMLFRSKNRFGGYTEGVALGLCSTSGRMIHCSIYTPEEFLKYQERNWELWWKKYTNLEDKAPSS